MLTCLPGRVAVLVKDAIPGSCIVLPEAIVRRAVEMERPPHSVMRGEVVAVGSQRGPLTMPRVGDRVWVLPKPGLIVERGDIDLPLLGRGVPNGHTLRFYGVGDPWYEQIVGFENLIGEVKD